MSVDITEDEYFAPLAGTPKVYMDIKSTSYDVPGYGAYSDIVERTLPTYTAGDYVSGRVIHIRLGFYEDIKELNFQRYLSATRTALETIIDDAFAANEDFIYSPDDGTTKYRVNLVGEGAYTVQQPEKSSETLRMRLIFKEVL